MNKREKELCKAVKIIASTIQYENGVPACNQYLMNIMEADPLKFYTFCLFFGDIGNSVLIPSDFKFELNNRINTDVLIQEDYNNAFNQIYNEFAYDKQKDEIYITSEFYKVLNGNPSIAGIFSEFSAFVINSMDNES